MQHILLRAIESKISIGTFFLLYLEKINMSNKSNLAINLSYNLFSCPKCNYTEQSWRFNKNKKGDLICPKCKTKLPQK